MTVTISAGHLQATIAEKGAELQSLIDVNTNLEYIWQADPAHWGKHAPILFPIVGALKDNQYRYKGETYHLPRHGFARDMMFEVVEHKVDYVRLLLASSEETKSNYPFDFQLFVSYELGGDGLVVKYQVVNDSQEDMFFSIGGHPAFNVPLGEDNVFEDFYLTFSPKKSRVKLPLVGNYIDLEQRTLGQTNTDLRLTHEMFKNDAMIYETKGLNSFSIRSEKSPHSVTLSYNNMPYVGFWTTYPVESPFLCIEPWVGIADTLETSGELHEKTGIQCLAANEQFETKYSITVK
ncbi:MULTISPECIES: aldose 1-epimerase family protein [Enterococcus]|uniref:aldose 1-epimerase family protein n=1 Tax=Enterococcus TaxID=1350 RepID=UPI0010FF6449|nr:MULTISPECIES: aldose 1-epimerase family protein [Enterococcus]QCT92330.1 aldose 1-epimerase family protein [Enterococcus sp. M190262]GMG58691.1 aldose 1-epimerase family protein [Enterococcus gallinarum]